MNNELPSPPFRPETDSWRGAMLEGALDAVVGLDQNLCVVDWNHEAELTFGWSKASIAGQTFPDKFFPAVDREALRARLKKFFLATETPAAERRFAVPAQHKDGSSLSAELTATLVRNGAETRIYLVVRSVPEASAPEPVFHFSEEKFRIHFEQAAYSVQLLSPAGRTLAVNKAWRELWGIPDEFIRSYIFAEYNVRHDPQLVAKGIMPFIERGFSGEPTEIPPILYDPNELGSSGKPRWVSGFIYPVKDRAGTITEVVLTHQDVTQAKQAEEGLRAAVRARDEFISICSHELKTPITSMKLQFQMAEKQLARGDASALAAPTVTKRTRIANQQLARMEHLIEEMLDVSRISAGKLRVSMEPVEFSGIVREVIERFSEQFDELGITVDSSDTARASVVLGDRYRLEQVLSNLLTNALKYGGGQPVSVALAVGEESLSLSVRDRGIGIAAENQDRIFGRFERAVSAANISGLGLGLYISRKIVEAHHGRIWVESAPEQGSTFFVEIPLLKAVV
jgi:PAS domain S-box-containing protein